MPSRCCVIDCNHATKKVGCKLKVFPTNSVRASQWENNIKEYSMLPWERKPYDRICSCHFDKKQWDYRPDGPKLKPNAQPLIFSAILAPEEKNCPLKEKELAKDPLVHNGLPKQKQDLPKVDRADVAEIADKKSTKNCDNILVNKSTCSCNSQVEKLKQRLEQKTMEEHTVWKELQETKKQLHIFTKKYEKLSASISKLYNRDQIQFLSMGRVRQWSDETILKSYQMKAVLGLAGYKYLIDNGHPYLSYASLCRKIVKPKKNEDIQL